MKRENIFMIKSNFAIIFIYKMSTISPLRASFTAQKRALRDSTAARYTTIPPKTA
jgi:hypothetical protein